MSFFPINPCCMEGTILPGEPKGVMETPEGKIKRYHASPSGGSQHPKSAIALFYDVFGLNIPNCKLIADNLADQSGIDVFVPDYLPYPLPYNTLDTVLPSYPNELSKRSYLSWIYNIFKVLSVIHYIPGFTGKVPVTNARQAVIELKEEGYTKVGGIGYCRGGFVIIQIMAEGDTSPLDNGIICHPAPVPMTTIATITKPTQFNLANYDMEAPKTFADDIRGVMAKKPEQVFELTVWPETTHGFGSRPNLGHELTKKAFEDVGTGSVKWFKQYLA